MRRGPVATALPLLVAACVSGGPETAEPSAPSRPPLPAGERVAVAESRPPAGDLVSAVATGHPDVGYVLALATLERCGTGPLGQQALLMLAAAELDPRNPDPHLSLAHEALALALAATDESSWSRILVESLYLVALQLGARPAPLHAGDESELRWRAWKGDEARSSIGHLTFEACRPLPWPSGPGSQRPTGDEGAPELAGDSYPARIAWLRRRVAELEAEIARLRRIASQP